jgi:diguanylate cyclase (GGDEF)-like protein/PAS domain S-box-containing protein
MLERLAQWTMSEIQLHSQLLAARRREQFLKNFFAITSEKTHSTEKKIEQLMQLGCEHFGYESGGVAILTHDQVGLNPYYGENREFVIPSFQISEEIFDEVVKREEPIKYIKGQANGSLVYELLKNNFDFDEMIGWRIFNKEEHRQEDTIIFIYMHTSISPIGNPALNQELLMILTQWIGQAYQSRKAHSEILSSEMRYKMVVESANDAIILADENMMIQAWNPAAQKMFQYTKEEALGSKVDIIIPDEFLQKHHTGMERFKKTRQGKIMGRMVELEGRRKDGHCFPIELSLYAWNNEKDLFFGCMIRDITERKRDQDIINNLAYRDTLTGLRNRTSFDEKIDWFFEKQRAFRLLFIDIDGFKAVNDTFGHTKGDLLLQAIAERLHSVLRLPEMVPYRYGGDEFLVLINNPEINKFSNIKEEIIEALSFPYYLKGDTIRVSASIGESSYPEHGDDLNKLLKAADTLMYQMKQKGGGR